MGRVTHLEAEKTREAISSRNFQLARETLAQALQRDSDNPDLVCEDGILSLYEGQETKAFELVPRAEGGSRFGELCRMLCERLHCKMLAEGEDEESLRSLKFLRSFYDGPLDQVGIRLSACLIVRDEEETLARCLESIKEIADEIVVVDTGSTDRTVEIARSFGAVIGEFEWCDDFSAARNRSLELATGHWALWIDADEELTPESAAAIKRAVQRPHFGGYDIEIASFTGGSGRANEFCHCAVRLFQRMEAVRFTGRIHEQVVPSLVELGLPWARLEGARLLHHGYQPEIMERKGKAGRTVRLLEREVRENPGNAFQWFNLANAYLVANRLAEAEHAAKRCISTMPANAPFGDTAYHVLAQAASNAGRVSAALAACAEAELKGFHSIPIQFEKCQALLRDNRADEALVVSDALMKMEWPEGSTGDRAIYTHKQFVLRAQILAVLLRYSEAMEMLDRALKVDPYFTAALYTQGAVLEKLGQFDAALGSFTRASADADSYCPAAKGQGRTLMALGRFKEAAEAFRSGWERSPQDHDAWIGWTTACESTGNVAAVLEAYDAFAKIHEPSADILINWGRALEAAGDVERALQCFTEAIKREPSSANAYFNCGDLLYRHGAASDAAHLYEAGLRFAPGNPEAWFTFGNALARTGLSKKAAEAYRQALQQNPRHEGALHNLAVVSTPESLAA